MKKIFLLILLLITVDSYAADQWEQMSNLPAVGRHRAAAFSIANKGYMGFGHINSVVNIALEDFWEYDPATNSWTQKADFGGGKRYHVLVFGVEGKGYVGCGRSASAQFNDFWEYDPATNLWTQLNDYPEGSRLGPLSFVIDNVAYCGTGTGTGNDNAFYKYHPSTDTWTSIAAFPGTSRATGVAFSLDGKGYVGTGSGSFGTGNDFWEYKPNLDQWLPRAPVPGLPRQGATGFAVNGRGYILTGNNWSENFKDMWEFNPGSNTWKQMDDFPGSSRRFMHSFVIHDKAYCGTGTTGINFNDVWRFDPLGDPKEKFLRTNIQVNVYPNPSVDYVNFEIPLELLEEYSTIELSIVDIAGRRIHQAEFYDTQLSFERNNLKNGVYCYHINADTEVLKSGKFILQ